MQTKAPARGRKRKQIALDARERAQTLSALARLERNASHLHDGEFDTPGREAILLGKGRDVIVKDPELAKWVANLEAQVARLTRQLQRAGLKYTGVRMEWPAEHGELQLARSQSPLGRQ